MEFLYKVIAYLLLVLVVLIPMHWGAMNASDPKEIPVPLSKDMENLSSVWQVNTIEQSHRDHDDGFFGIGGDKRDHVLAMNILDLVRIAQDKNLDIYYVYTKEDLDKHLIRTYWISAPNDIFEFRETYEIDITRYQNSYTEKEIRGSDAIFEKNSSATLFDNAMLSLIIGWFLFIILWGAYKSCEIVGLNMFIRSVAELIWEKIKEKLNL